MADMNREMVARMLGQTAAPLPVPEEEPKRGGIGKVITDVLDGVGGALLELRRLSPKYQQELRLIEALKGFENDPMGAAARAVQSGNVKTGLAFYDTLADNERLQGAANAQIDATNALTAEREARREELTHRRAAAILASATKETLPQIRKQYYDYYDARGIQPLFEVGEDFDQVTQDMIQWSMLSPEDQVRIREQRQQYATTQQNMDRRQTRSITATDDRAAANRTSAEERARLAREAANERARLDREQRERLAARRAGLGKPDIKYEVRNGKRVRVQ